MVYLVALGAQEYPSQMDAHWLPIGYFDSNRNAEYLAQVIADYIVVPVKKL